MPKADAEAALNIIQERCQRAESGSRLRHKEERREEDGQRRDVGWDEEEKEELYYFCQKRIMLLFKEFVHIHLPFFPKPPYQGYVYRQSQLTEPWPLLLPSQLIWTNLGAFKETSV